MRKTGTAQFEKLYEAWEAKRATRREAAELLDMNGRTLRSCDEGAGHNHDCGAFSPERGLFRASVAHFAGRVPRELGEAGVTEMEEANALRSIN